MGNRDQYYMQQAIMLAQKARGQTSPNPMVGAVVVKEGRIVGQGYHQQAGKPHAEVLALREAGEKARGATLYVNLEPCSHQGQTPPCTEMIIDRGLSRVVAAMVDPNPRVSGEGLAQLQEAGIEVSCGVLSKRAARLNEVFIKYITTGLPFVYLKGAMSLDGKIATWTGDARWITSDRARENLHHLRHEVDSILVGRGTVAADDPLLTTRLPQGGGRDSLRVILDSSLSLAADYKIFNLDDGLTVLAVAEGSLEEGRAEPFLKQGVRVIELPEKQGRVDLSSLLRWLGKASYTSLLVEGGSQVHASFVEQGLADRLMLYVAPRIIGGSEAYPLVGGRGFSSVEEAVELDNLQVKRIGCDLLISGYFRRRD